MAFSLLNGRSNKQVRKDSLFCSSEKKSYNMSKSYRTLGNRALLLIVYSSETLRPAFAQNEPVKPRRLTLRIRQGSSFCYPQKPSKVEPGVAL